MRKVTSPCSPQQPWLLLWKEHAKGRPNGYVPRIGKQLEPGFAGEECQGSRPCIGKSASIVGPVRTWAVGPRGRERPQAWEVVLLLLGVGPLQLFGPDLGLFWAKNLAGKWTAV